MASKKISPSLYLDIIHKYIPIKDLAKIIDNYCNLTWTRKCILDEHIYIHTMITLPNGDIVSDVSINIKIWRNYKCIHTLFGHTDYITCLTTLPNGDIVSGSYDQTIKIWRNYVCIQTLVGHDDTVWIILALPNGDIVSGTYYSALKIWRNNNITGEYHSVISLPYNNADDVRCLVSLPNGDLVTGHCNETIKIWRDHNLICTLNDTVKEEVDNSALANSAAATTEEEEEYSADTIITCLAVLLNGDLVSGSSDGIIQIWRNNICIKTIIAHREIIYSLEVMTNGDLVSCSYDCWIKIWRDGVCINTIDSYGLRMQLTTLPNGNLAGSGDGIYIWQ